MENAKQAETTITPKGKMNIWVGEQIKFMERLIEAAKGCGAGENVVFIRGVRTGISMLQDRWLNGDFDNH